LARVGDAHVYARAPDGQTRGGDLIVAEHAPDLFEEIRQARALISLGVHLQQQIGAALEVEPQFSRCAGSQLGRLRAGMRLGRVKRTANTVANATNRIFQRAT
jgi:hypothetical protein